MPPESAAGVVRWRSPGRVNLVGDHTDHQDGFCLPMAIDRECRVEFVPDGTAILRARSGDLPGEVRVDADGRVTGPDWGRFVAAAAEVVAAGVDRGAVPGGTLTVASTVPAGAGLSSSAALSVALVGALTEAAGRSLVTADLAAAARATEIAATGVPCGILDQTAVTAGAAGHALLLDCRSLAVTPITVPDHLAIVVVHSGRTRRLADGGYAERVAACRAAATRLGLRSLRDAAPADVADDPAARHVVSENARVLAAAEALRAGDGAALGALMSASHASLRDDFGVSSPELDATVERLVAAGAFGARLTGAGFGGCVVGVAPSDRADAVVAHAVRSAAAATGTAPLAFVVGPAEPAGPMVG